MGAIGDIDDIIKLFKDLLGRNHLEFQDRIG